MGKKTISRFGWLITIFLITFIFFLNTGSAGEFSADMVGKSSMGIMKGKVFFKGDNFRQEMLMEGRKQITIFRKDKGVVWVLMPEQMMYLEMTAAGQQNMAPVKPEEMEKLGKRKYLGEEKVNGYICSKYSYTPNDSSSGPATYWISKKLNFPVKMETTGPRGKMVMEYKNIREGKVSGSLFNIPSEYRKMSMPLMPGMKKQ
jgi:outer membrane lipoprotein-sorting protein